MASPTAWSEVRLCVFLREARKAKRQMQEPMIEDRLTIISRIGRVLLGWVSDFHRGYGNLKGHKEGLGCMDGSDAGGSLSRDIKAESLRFDAGSGSSEWSDGSRLTIKVCDIGIRIEIPELHTHRTLV